MPSSTSFAGTIPLAISRGDCSGGLLLPDATGDLPDEYRTASEKVREAAAILDGARAGHEPDARFASPATTWEHFRRSMRRGDVDAALDSFTPPKRRAGGEWKISQM